jgi:hypothetical protein
MQATTRHIMHWAARWAEGGFPRVALTTEQTAALMLTDLTEEQVELARPPWRAFVITMPPDALVVEDRDGVSYPLQRVGVMRYETSAASVPHLVHNKRWVVRADFGRGAGDGFYLWSLNRTNTELYAPDAFRSWDRSPDLLAMEENEERAIHIIGRLVVNLCVAMSDPTMIRKPAAASAPAARGVKQSRTARRAAQFSQGVTYTLGLPVTVNFKDAVHGYVSGDVKQLRNVRWVVRGHFRQQAHGPGRTLRTQKYIEPHWAGREGAPILVRSHKLDGGSRDK